MKQIALSITVVLAMVSSSWGNCVSGPASPRLTVDNGLVLDAATGLAWQLCLYGQTPDGAVCNGKATELSWKEADRIAKDSGWRLPKLEDLETILSGEGDGGLFPSPFSACQSGQIWTASPGFPVNDVAAVLDLETGQVWGIGKGVERQFVLVRGEIDIEYHDGVQPEL